VVNRFLLFSAMFAAGSGGPAGAQSVSVPGDGSPPACQHLMALRDEAQKNGLALKRKPPPLEACKLFNTFVDSESEFVRGLAESQAECGIPVEAVERAKVELETINKIRRQICEIAASRGRLYPAPDFQEPLPAPDNGQYYSMPLEKPHFLPKDLD
jgi:hypothetical protein